MTEESIEKRNNTYIFDGDENKIAIPYSSQDGQQFLVLAKFGNKAIYKTFLKKEIYCEEGQCIWEAAANLTMAYLEDDD